MAFISTPLPLCSPNNFHSTPLRTLISQGAKGAAKRNEKSSGPSLSDGFIVHLSTRSRERKKVRGSRRVEASQPTVFFEWRCTSSLCACLLVCKRGEWVEFWVILGIVSTMSGAKLSPVLTKVLLMR